MWVTSGSLVGHIRIALWVSGSSGSTGVTHFQPCSLVFMKFRYANLQAFVSVGESIIVMDYNSHVTIKGLQMLYSRKTAIEANQGSLR